VSPQQGKTTVAKVPSPLWVGIRNSALTPPYKAKSGRDKFHTTAPDPKTPEKYRTGPQEICAGSPQPGNTMGIPGTLPLMGGHP